MLSLLLILVGCKSYNGESVQNIEVDFNSMWNYSNPKETRDIFTELLNKSLEKDLDYRLQLQTQIARTHSLMSQFEQAHKILDDVEGNLSTSTLVAKIRYSLERGRTFNSAGDKSKAKVEFIKAYELAKEVEADNYTIDGAHMIAIASPTLDEKVKWSDIGVEVANSSKNSKAKRWIGVFLNNTGWDLFEAKRYQEALAKFEACLKFHQDQGNKSSADIASWSVAKTYRLLGRIQESLNIQLSLLAEVNGVDKSGYTYEELGELYYLQGNKEEYKKYFKQAHEVLSKDTWLVKNEKERIDRLSDLSK